MLFYSIPILNIVYRKYNFKRLEPSDKTLENPTKFHVHLFMDFNIQADFRECWQARNIITCILHDFYKMISNPSEIQDTKWIFFEFLRVNSGTALNILCNLEWKQIKTKVFHRQIFLLKSFQAAKKIRITRDDTEYSCFWEVVPLGKREKSFKL